MKDIVNKTELVKIPRIGEIIEGTVLGKEKGMVFFDLGSLGSGVIYGKEFIEAKDALKILKPGSKAAVKIIGLENDQGYIELSITRAGKELAWETLFQNKKDGVSLPVKIVGANKGGLLAKVLGIPAFIPTSQLGPDHYPKVEGADSQKILLALQKLIGQEINVKIFDLDPREDKLILSEKAMETEKIREILSNFKVGDVVEGEITGIVDFGAFIKFSSAKDATKKSKDDSKEIPYLEGLIHISELDWQLIESPAEVVKVGQTVKAKIIDISNDRVSLSLKALKTDPWQGIEEKFKKGDVVRGKVTKINPFGAFIQLGDKIQGLCHISEFGTSQKMEETIRVSKEYNFEILTIEPKDHKMSLKLATEEKEEKK